MRIFNWVNRKLHHKDGQHEYCRGISKNVAKERRSVEYGCNGVNGIDVEDVDALLLNGWSAGGILTIGTLGLMVLGDHNGSVDAKGSEEEYEDVEEEYTEEEEETCLVNNNGDIIGRDLDSNNEEDQYYEDEDEDEDEEDVDDHCLVIMETKEEGSQKTTNNYDNGFGFGLGSNNDDHKIINHADNYHVNPFIKEGPPLEEKKKERTTLADLFSAEYSDEHVGKTRKPSVINNRRIWPTTAYHFKDNSKKRDQNATNEGSNSAGSLSFAKRLIPLTGIDKKPVKKFHKLMRRMLNRKIHPELGGKLPSINDEPVDEEVPSYVDVANVESISLLRTRDV